MDFLCFPHVVKTRFLLTQEASEVLQESLVAQRLAAAGVKVVQLDWVAPCFLIEGGEFEKQFDLVVRLSGRVAPRHAGWKKEQPLSRPTNHAQRPSGDGRAPQPRCIRNDWKPPQQVQCSPRCMMTQVDVQAGGEHIRMVPWQCARSFPTHLKVGAMLATLYGIVPRQERAVAPNAWGFFQWLVGAQCRSDPPSSPQA